MLKLVRVALAAAILTAIAIRLRRRAHTPARRPEPAAARPDRSPRMGLVWAAIAAIVAVTLAAALMPPEAERADAAAPTGPPVTHTLPVPTAVPTWQPTEIPDPNCSPAQRPVTVRPIDPKVRRAVDRQWRRIERWLEANAPRTYKTLGPPGRARTIAVAESQMGVDFPDDLRASLLRHNGSRGHSVFGFWFDGTYAFSIREIRDTWRWLCSWERTDLGTDPATEYWNGRMIPFLHFADRDSEDMEYAVVDSDGGAVGWDDTISGMAPRLPSTHALLRAVADALEQGKEVDGWRPAVRRGVLRWDNVE
ncbi:SMI1/KNR4 family protein SUKH-1 [Nonomuraea polychroma]|uniref:SMI1/KNR4 family protein SUKH-1 n=1 Tax=Nonomuraea polychroma TaxID=46176 RepID=A0A438M0I2_9ACTN|nr:SMI1/KNR4 family protein [Nonomuraea polychroma]RVX39324.1 SMI1/KNR4 family protein SUKH-1 [Nonomuraea polychroma]